VNLQDVQDIYDSSLRYVEKLPHQGCICACVCLCVLVFVCVSGSERESKRKKVSEKNYSSAVAR